MANIGVVLTIDNKQYLGSLKAAKDATNEFATSAKSKASEADTSFQKLNQSSQNLSETLGRLKTALGIAAFLGFARSALDTAGAIADMSSASGIAIQNILALQSAVQGAGGNAEKAGNSLQFLLLQIDAAAEGSGTLQASFSKVGVSVNDLATLTEQEILQKVIDGLAGMSAGAEKAALQNQLLGKSMRGVTIDQDFAQSYRDGTAASGEYADSIMKADKLGDQMAETVKKLKIAFVEAFAPAIEAITTLLQDIPKLTTALKVFGAVLVGVMVASGIRTVLTGIQGVSFALSKAYDGIKAIKNLGGIAGAFGKAAKSPDVGKAVGAVAGVAAAGAAGVALMGSDSKTESANAAQEAAKKIADAQEKERQKIREVEDAYAKKSAAIQQTVADYQKASNRIADQIDLETSLLGKSKENADFEKAKADLYKRSQDEIDKLTLAKQNMSKEDRALGLGGVYDKQIESVKRLRDAEETRLKTVIGFANEAQKKEQLRLFGIQQQIEVNKQLNDLIHEAATMLLPEMEKRYAAIEKKARDVADAEIAAEEKRRGAALTDNERLAYFEKARQSIERIKEATAKVLEIEQQRDLILFQTKRRIDSENELQKITDDMAKMTLPALEQKYYDIEAAAKAAAKAQIEAQAQKLNRDLSPEEQAKYYKAAREGLDSVKKKSKEAYEESRRFETGWRKAFNEYVDNATNAAKQAENIFNKAMGGIEDLIVNFVKTGKFEWKSFVASMAEELLRSQLKQTFAGIMESMGSGDGILGSIGGLFGMGKNAGQRGNSASQPLYVLDISNSGVGGARAMSGVDQGGGGLLDSIMNLFGGGPEQLGGPGTPEQSGGFFDTLTTGLGDFFSGFTGPQQLGGPEDSGGILGSIGDFFGGFFAGGGMLGAGKFGIAGENGPEFIGGPASVSPMGGSNVTYNINAVDAMSFKALIASDPGFIHAVAMQGSMSTPGRR